MERIVFENGIRLVTDHIESHNTFSMGIFLPYGSKYETKEESGISHFIEHLLFQENYYFNKREINELVENIGGRINAFTTKEYMCIYVECLKEYSSYVADLIYKLIAFPVFKQEDIDQEKKVIINEIYLHMDNYYEVCQQNLLTEIWKNHMLSSPILGDITTISKMKSDYISNFYFQNLNPRQIVISVSGNYEGEVLTILEEKFSDLSKKENYRLESALPDYKSSNVIAQRDTAQNFIMMGFPMFSHMDSKLLAFMIFNQLFGIGASSILFKELRDNHGLVYMVHSYPLIYKEGGLFIISASLPKVNDTDYLIQETFKKINHYRDNGMNKDEFNTSKLKLLGQMALEFENTRNRMLELGKYEFLGLYSHSEDEGVKGIFKLVKKQEISSTNEAIFKTFSYPASISIINSVTKSAISQCQ
ncbi:pitrilysin family protein [Paenibacillus sp. ISL-20]|uniref:M16 family metallopeptidase n=1 Tax=Paenibacillus sp. ISL-20 TaxID=2819163 RepID=UPI001BECC519|nr:pitrilysin family protein [Paenibacillus sp. ISL-20]MBT2760605.1 insulinase family protein [Paenibacillus sp. ISL-20]